MKYRKPVCLLAGGRPRSREMLGSLIQAVLRENGAASPTVAYMGMANNDDEGFFNYIADIFREIGACKVEHASISSDKADLEKAQDILKSAEIVFTSGGDVDRGMRVLKEKNMIDFLSRLYDKGKLFCGLSAGSIMLSKEWVRWRDPNDDSTAELFPCLGFAPIICDMHGEQDDWQELRVVLNLEKGNVKGYGIVTGGGIKVFPDGRIEVLGSAIHQYVRHGEIVERSSDILPVNNTYRD